MTSQKKVEANRKNAQKSTGPRSSSGKVHSGRNALRHGLATSISDLPGEQNKIDEIADEIAAELGLKKGYLIVSMAESAAELGRIRKARAALIHDDRDLAGLVKTIAMLKKLERYESRALSRRRSALRVLALS
jgi:hypothetical protein